MDIPGSASGVLREGDLFHISAFPYKLFCARKDKRSMKTVGPLSFLIVSLRKIIKPFA
jgi:hypothetical protein